MNNPAPFVNTPPPRRGPGCWAIGGVTCLVVLVLGALVLVGTSYSLLHSPSGKKFGAAVGGMIRDATRGATQAQACSDQMVSVRDAVIRYHISKGVYPKDLKALVPEFLPAASTLHCASDPAADLKHVTFVYTRPPEGASGTTPLLAFTWTLTVALEGQTQITETTVTMPLDGKTKQSQKIIQNGKVIRTTAPA